MTRGDRLIASPANPRVRAAAALRVRRERDQTGLILVDGAAELLRAIQAGITVETVFICHERCRSTACEELVERLGPNDPRLVPVTETALSKLAFGDRADGVVAVARRPELGLDRIRLPEDPLVVVVEGVEKPGNLGAILRSADGAGVDALVAADPRTDLFNPNAIRASLGTIFAVPLAAGSSTEVLAWLREERDPDRRRPRRRPDALQRDGPDRAARARPRQRGRGPEPGLVGPRGRARPAADARRGRQPQRVRRRRRAPVRGPPPARRAGPSLRPAAPVRPRTPRPRRR